jgi:hypothetical protein
VGLRNEVIHATWNHKTRAAIGGSSDHPSIHRSAVMMMNRRPTAKLLLVFQFLTCGVSSWKQRGRFVVPTAFRGGAKPGGGELSTTAAAGTSITTTTDSYLAKLEAIKSQVLQEIAQPELSKLRQSIVEEGSVIEGFGSKADELCDKTVAAFCDRAPPPPESAVAAAAYDAVLADVERSVDAPLQVLYLKQLAYLRELALQQFRGAKDGASYENMLRADADFVEAAVSSTRETNNSEWDYSQERGYLQAVLNMAAEQASKRSDLMMETAEKQQAAMSVLQYQNQMIQQLQSQLYGQSSPWNIGMAYRIPDTNFNVQGSYQQGRANVQVSCVPDEYAPLLGPNGFTNGVGPGNLGLSLNLSL